MFGILFGWRKASKCKKLIKRVQCRLKLLKNKRYTIVRQLRDDVAQLIKIGYEESAFNRAEQLFKDENTMAVYELLDHFCEFIIIHLSYIRKHKDCPNDINEAVSSLIFSSARCGDLPELRAIRKLFGERYGQRFATAAVELFPGNLVNREIKEKLSLNSVPDDVKCRLVDEIARDYCLRSEILAIEYTSELQQQVNENSGQQILLERDIPTCYSKIEESPIRSSNANEMDRKAKDIADSSSTIKCPSHGHRNSDMISTSISSSIIQQSSPDILESPKYNKAEKVGKFRQMGSLYEFTVTSLDTKESQQNGRVYRTIVKHKEERMTAASSSESLPPFPEEMVVYLDDIEEFKSSMIKDGDCHDQSLFKFKSPLLPKREKSVVDCYMGQYESLSEKSGSRKSAKRSRGRSVSQENSVINDIESLIYYDKPCKNSPSHKHRSRYHKRHPKKTQVEETEQSGNDFHSGKLCNCNFNCKTNVCSLDHPCYFCTGDDKDDPRRRSYDNGASVYDVFTYPGNLLNKQSKKAEEKKQGFDSPGNCASSNNCHQKEINYGMGKGRVPPYLRAMTMPQERPKESCRDSILRANSCSFQYPNHVHPKLPDYDDIEAKFMALKKDRIQNKHQ